MVGIGGGVLRKLNIRLGDVVVGNEVVQFDFGKTTQGGQFNRTNILARPPQSILTAVTKFRSDPPNISYVLSWANNLEKSVFGMYQSLLSQLFTKLPALRAIFNSLGSAVWAAWQIPDWTVEILKDILEQVISQLGGSPMACFIDALDEYNQEEICDMISFFERIGKLATPRGFELRVCPSSRHYPHITVKSGVHLALEEQRGHAEDITKCISDKLNIGQSRRAKQIRHELRHQSSGVFMWVVLVVEILNREYEDGYIHLLQKRFREIPSDLHKLFRDILTLNDHHRLKLRLCLQWIIFAKDPLKPEKLYCAILSGTEDRLGWCDLRRASADDMKRFILSSSKG